MVRSDVRTASLHDELNRRSQCICAGAATLARDQALNHSPVQHVFTNGAHCPNKSSDIASQMQFDVVTLRQSAHQSEARCKQAMIMLDTDCAGNSQAFDPAELLLAALSACMIMGIKRVAPILKFQLRGV